MKFNIGDKVVMTPHCVGSQKSKDIGKPATITRRGNSFDWRINMDHRTTRVHATYDWGADEEYLELADGPW